VLDSQILVNLNTSWCVIC